MRFLVILVSLVAALAAGADRAAAQLRQDWTKLREEMVQKEVVGGGVKNPRVIEAVRQTPRHEFVPLPERHRAYFDMALPIGNGQTISAPFIVAYMTETIDPQPDDRVLEIGTGSGYQAAVLSPLVKEVYTIEIVEPLGRRAAKDLKRLKYANVFPRVGDGYLGWPDKAPFDKIIVTCSPEKVPQALIDQLKEGGRMIIPVGQRYQQVFYLLRKRDGELKTEALRPTIFVPMTGEAEKRREVLPDPKHPEIVNGDFEEAAGDPLEPTGWHYQRQLELLEDGEAPSGKRYVRFTNTEPGRYSQALQCFAVDGRAVKAFRVSVRVRGKDIAPGQNLVQLPCVGLTFYDGNRAIIEDKVLGPWRGTFAWQNASHRFAVPPKAREAMLRIGLLGAVGELYLDALKLEPTEAK